jgi:hypothetical protein
MTDPSAIHLTMSLSSPGLRRIVTFEPAFDRRHEDPKKNYGIHGVTLRMVVAGEEGATQFVVYTNWMLPHVADEMATKPCRLDYNGKCGCATLSKPMAADLGYHRKTPSYPGQTPMGEKCEYTGADCYYDGSGLNAERVLDILTKEGDEGVWRELESYYQEVVVP